MKMLTALRWSKRAVTRRGRWVLAVVFLALWGVSQVLAV